MFKRNIRYILAIFCCIAFIVGGFVVIEDIPLLGIGLFGLSVAVLLGVLLLFSFWDKKQVEKTKKAVTLRPFDPALLEKDYKNYPPLKKEAEAAGFTITNYIDNGLATKYRCMLFVDVSKALFGYYHIDTGFFTFPIKAVNFHIVRNAAHSDFSKPVQAANASAKKQSTQIAVATTVVGGILGVLTGYGFYSITEEKKYYYYLVQISLNRVVHGVDNAY